jgi:hypothetical protein
VPKWVRKWVRIASGIEGEIGRNNFKFQCAKTGHKYASKITYMQVNMQLIGLGIALDLKGCMLDIKKKKGCILDILKT